MATHSAANINSRRLGQGAIFLCAVLWSTSGLFIKLIDWHPFQIAGARSVLAILVLLAAKFLRSGRRRRITAAALRHRGAAQELSVIPSSPMRPERMYIIAGGSIYAATMLLFVTANKLTASANAILLQYSAPVWAALLAWGLAREKPRWEQWGALALVMGGSLLFFKDGLAGGSLAGDGIALLSGICFGANSAFMRMIRDGDPADSMLLAHIITACFSIPFFFLYPPALSGAILAAITFMGIVQIGFASLLFSYGIKRITAVQAMLTATIEPVLNPLWVLLVTGERPAASALAGGSIIVAAVVVSSLIGKRRAKSP